MRWTVKVERDDFSEDYYIILPDEILEKMDWYEGDTLTMDTIKSGIELCLQTTKKEIKNEKK
jgi:bifunctional DNA-binding transcriptional regulator/antitoxin component of YhaV-PrlF toxin-antitoxin module